jgi:hypothetical protein
VINRLAVAGILLLGTIIAQLFLGEIPIEMGFAFSYVVGENINKGGKRENYEAIFINNYLHL